MFEKARAHSKLCSLSFERAEERRLLAGDLDFADPVSYLTGDFALFVAAADLDGDSNLDLVVANFMRNDVSVLLGTGGGQWAAEARYPVGEGPFSIVVDDFNGDTILDIVTANANSNSASLLLGKGDGTFQHQTSYAVNGESPADIVAGDLDGDGDLDLVTANQYSRNISVLMGNGQGGFASAVTLPTLQGGASGVTAGDFDDDGDFDLAVANYFFGNTKLSIFIGHGDGTFDGAALKEIGHESFNLTNADLNADGKTDLAVATLEGVSILLGQGNGTFAEPTLYNSGGQPFSVQTADIDGDGNLDVAVGNWEDGGPGNVAIMLGTGDGTFQQEPKIFRPDGNWIRITDENSNGPSSKDLNTRNNRTPYNVAVGDLDNDGDLDIAASHNHASLTDPSVLSLLLNRSIENPNYVGGRKTTGTQTLHSLNDLAQDGIATQSSEKNSRLGPSKAIDGDLSSSSVTADDDEQPWWQVELSRTEGLEQIVLSGVQNRNPLTDGGGLLVQVLDENANEVWQELYKGTQTPLRIDLSAGGRIEGKVIRVSKTAPFESALFLSQVEIMGADIVLDAQQFPIVEFDLDAESQNSDLLRTDGLLQIVGVTLRATLLQGELHEGMHFQVLDTAGTAGMFARLDLPELPPDLRWNISQLYAQGLLTIDTAGPMGDVDGDGKVDFRDFLILSSSFGEVGDGLLADLDNNDSVDFGDFLILSDNFGSSRG